MTQPIKCPACFNALTLLQVGRVTVDVCHSCGGIWFDAFELRQVDEEHETAGEWLLQIGRDERITVDSQRKRDCPRCQGIKLKRHYYSPRRQVEVDECPGCGGYWLDAGELEKIREETETERRQAVARATVVTGKVIRYLYQMRAIRRDDSPES
jgi:Zn-finger nucleic acid-binding protein